MTAARNIQNIVGPRIREHREKAGLSQPQLVAKCNLEGWDITREMLAKIETQVRKVADFEVLCLSRALGVPVDSLVPDDRGGDKGDEEVLSEIGGEWAESWAVKLEAKGVTLDQTAISRIENQTRYVMDYEAVAIAKALKVSVGWLFGER